MDVTSHLVAQAIFRISFAACLSLGIIPGRLSPPGFFWAMLGGLSALNALAALLIYSAAGSSDPDYVLLGFATTLAVASGLAALAGSQHALSWRPYAVFVVGLAAFVASLFSIRWQLSTTGLGTSLAVLDLASGGLLLATILSAILLAVWHLHTAKMEEAPLVWMVRLMTVALVVRVLVAIVTLAAEMLQGQLMAPAGIFLVLRCILASLGLWMLILLKGGLEDESGEPVSSGWLVVGLLLASIGELATHMVPLDGLYAV